MVLLELLQCEYFGHLQLVSLVLMRDVNDFFSPAQKLYIYISSESTFYVLSDMILELWGLELYFGCFLFFFSFPNVFLHVSTGYISSFRDWMQLYLEI